MSALIIPKCLRPERGVFMEEKLPQKRSALLIKSDQGRIHYLHLIHLVMLTSITGLRWFLPGLGTVKTFSCSLSIPYHLEVSHSSSSHSRGGKVIGINSNCLIKKICPFPHIYLFVQLFIYIIMDSWIFILCLGL